jgi:hypothetical protein
LFLLCVCIRPGCTWNEKTKDAENRVESFHDK